MIREELLNFEMHPGTITKSVLEYSPLFNLTCFSVPDNYGGTRYFDQFTWQYLVLKEPIGASDASHLKVSKPKKNNSFKITTMKRKFP